MRGYLLDTHTLVWFDGDPARLSEATRDLLEMAQDPVYVSSISLWEMAIKVRLGKFPEAQGLVTGWSERCEQLRWTELALSGLHARDAATMEWEHRDPFDRALAAQARVEGLTLVTRDPVFATVPGLTILW